jgi:hypothetical protein
MSGCSAAPTRPVPLESSWLEESGTAFGNKGVVCKEEAGRAISILADSDSRRDQNVVGHKAIIVNLQIGFR